MAMTSDSVVTASSGERLLDGGSRVGQIRPGQVAEPGEVAGSGSSQGSAAMGAILPQSGRHRLVAAPGLASSTTASPGMPAAVLDERTFALLEDLCEVCDVPPGRDREVDEQQAQHRLDADAACGHVDASVNGPAGAWRWGWPRRRGSPRLPGCQCQAISSAPGVIQEVVPVSGRTDVPAFPAVGDKLELVTEDELDDTDAGRGEAERIFGQRQGFHVAGLPSARDEQLRVRYARQRTL